jgi:Fur family ferric uptake transcriptional regulator
LDHDQLIDAFRNYLRGHNLPITAQRLAIADIVLRSAEHVSAEDIMIQLGARGAYAGTATVYRTLELLLRGGLIVARDFGEGFKRYEAAMGEPHHEHLQCDSCGRITEIRDDRMVDMTRNMSEGHGFLRTGHKLVITGICGECRDRGDDVGSSVPLIE